MALSQSALSEPLEAFRTGDGVDMIRESVPTVLQELVEFEAAGGVGAERNSQFVRECSLIHAGFRGAAAVPNSCPQRSAAPTCAMIPPKRSPALARDRTDRLGLTGIVSPGFAIQLNSWVSSDLRNCSAGTDTMRRDRPCRRSAGGRHSFPAQRGQAGILAG